MSAQLRAFLLRGIIGLSVMLAALTPAKAQTVSGVHVNIPFDFVVAGERLQAGDYYLRRDSTGQGVLTVTNRDERTSSFFMADFEDHPFPQGRARLIFDRYEDQYFLREVWITWAESYELPESRAERSVERESARDSLQRIEVVPIADSQ